MDNVLAIKITSDSTTLPSPNPAAEGAAATSDTLAVSADGWLKQQRVITQLHLISTSKENQKNFNVKANGEKNPADDLSQKS